MNDSSVKLRRPTLDDITEIEDLAKRYSNNPLPEKFETAAIIEQDDEITAFAVLRSMSEALLYCDEHTKLLAIRKLIDAAKVDAKKLGHQSIYAFIQDDKFCEILIKRYGFRKVFGTPVILDLESDNGQ
jgi:hypothetical protein